MYTYLWYFRASISHNTAGLGNVAHAQVDRNEEGIARMVTTKDRIAREEHKLVVRAFQIIQRSVF